MQNLLSLLKAESLDLVLPLIIYLETLCLSFLERSSRDMMQENCCFIFGCSGLKWCRSVFKKKKKSN